MSASEHPTSRPALSDPYGAPGRSGRPLLFLIPIAVAVALCLTLFGVGLRYLTAPIGSGTQSIAQNVTPVHGPTGQPEDEAGAPAGKPLAPPAQARAEQTPPTPQQARANAAG